MSSPNLNVVTLLGSGLTYTSAYLFGIQEQSLPSRDSVETLIQVSGARPGRVPPHTNTSVDMGGSNGSITSWPPYPWCLHLHLVPQVRLCLLCVGTSLVLGPVLGKSWRLYKVFTQRVPDKRVVSSQPPPW